MAKKQIPENNITAIPLDQTRRPRNTTQFAVYAAFIAENHRSQAATRRKITKGFAINTA
jgi:hypothetical protein